MAEEKSIFRKSSLERISSPEQLNEYIKVTSPSLFVILLAIFIVLLSLGVWLFKAEIPKYVNIEGIIASDIYEPDTQKLYCYVPISTSKRISKNMEVQVSPDFASKEEYGYMHGIVSEVGDEIITGSYLNEKFSNPSILSPIFSSQSTQTSNLVEITIDLGGWSNQKGQEEVEITEGTTCNAAIIIGKQKAKELIFT